MNKVYHFIIKKLDSPPQPTTLTLLTSPQKRGQCFKCELAKEIWVTSERPIWIGSTATYEERKFCWSCAFGNLYELERGDYQIANKKEVIKEIRDALKQLVYSSPSETQSVAGDQKDQEIRSYLCNEYS